MCFCSDGLIKHQVQWISKVLLVLVAQLCLTLWGPSGSFVNGILQVRLLEGVATPFSGGSF